MAIQVSLVDMEKRKALDIRAGDSVRVTQKIPEKGKFRLQVFEGLVLARKHGKEAGGTFTVRRVASGVGVAAVVGGGYYVMQNRARQTPTYQEQTNTPPSTTQATTKPSAPQARVVPYIETPPERETDPISEDWLDIAIAHGATESVDITGWSVRSTNSGKSFTIGTVVPHGSTAPIRVVLTGDEGGAFIHTVGSPSKNYFV